MAALDADVTASLALVVAVDALEAELVACVVARATCASPFVVANPACVVAVEAAAAALPACVVARAT